MNKMKIIPWWVLVILIFCVGISVLLTFIIILKHRSPEYHLQRGDAVKCRIYEIINVEKRYIYYGKGLYGMGLTITQEPDTDLGTLFIYKNVDSKIVGSGDFLNEDNKHIYIVPEYGFSIVYKKDGYDFILFQNKKIKYILKGLRCEKIKY